MYKPRDLFFSLKYIATYCFASWRLIKVTHTNFTTKTGIFSKLQGDMPHSGLAKLHNRFKQGDLN
jgi:hypothetical protein